MATDAEQYATIKTQTLARIVEITASAKPTYEIDGQKIAWSDYLKELQAKVDWCNQKLAENSPSEVISQAYT